MNLSDRVLISRKAKKMSQAELARKAGLSQATISDIERGRNQSTTEVGSLAKALGISVDFLLTGKSDGFKEDSIAQVSNEDMEII